MILMKKSGRSMKSDVEEIDDVYGLMSRFSGHLIIQVV